MTKDHITALQWRGITPPLPQSRKTTCPVCSHARAKSGEKCMSVFPHPDRVEWMCHHCGWEDVEHV